jgi:hypothetical protein
LIMWAMIAGTIPIPFTAFDWYAWFAIYGVSAALTQPSRARLAYTPAGPDSTALTNDRSERTLPAFPVLSSVALLRNLDTADHRYNRDERLRVLQGGGRLSRTQLLHRLCGSDR